MQTVTLIGRYIGAANDDRAFVQCQEIEFVIPTWKQNTGGAGSVENIMTAPATVILKGVGEGRERLTQEWTHIVFVDREGQRWEGTLANNPPFQNMPDGIRAVVHPVTTIS